MTMESFKQFAAAIKATYPKETILNTSEAVEIWFEFLQDIPDDVAMTVLKHWIANNKWSPAIADIREGAVKLVHGEAPDWGDAWEKVMKAVSRFGRYEEQAAMDSFDEVTRAVVQNIGFLNICNAEIDEVGFLKKDFERLYGIKVNRMRRELQTPAAIGATAQNLLKGA